MKHFNEMTDQELKDFIIRACREHTPDHHSEKYLNYDRLWYSTMFNIPLQERIAKIVASVEREEFRDESIIVRNNLLFINQKARGGG